ncbi:Sapep family Mn(2+)-dependent dipeptidase [Collinsella sp. AGMB00827]|uniref:Sapep family Mn(2+)-dependent dipeptidase n=2 Tax=Collinsella ureilytica TaxID=2869515 RepID=A0ABS7MM58_9ACTN|nr:Sapep family Mn(2+)-dependent dipeptidase [Collinsella urealyticum]
MNAELNQDIDTYIDEVWDDVCADIAHLVSYPSVADTALAAPNAPFGPHVRAALDAGLGIAKRLGYAVSDDEGYMGMADIAGKRSEQIATIAHIDVVPAGPGWDSDPFTMRRREGWFIGRGVIDDKGPAVLSLYAGAYFLRRNIVPNYSFRALLGCDEEVGMTDVQHYLKNHPEPAFLFTPDAEFPVCNAEKGVFAGSFTSVDIEQPRILAWSGAEAGNAIPGQSVLELAVDARELPEPKVHADRITIEAAAPGVSRISARGIGGHASLPEGTLNAIGIALTYLREIDADLSDFLRAEERAFVELLAILLADTTGEAAGIACANEAFGALTLNAGTIAVRSDSKLEQSVDIRFPDATTGDDLAQALRLLAERFGASFTVGRVKDPFSVSADSPAVQALLETYSEVVGTPAAPFSMGGGTYARNFKRAVSFGPEDRDRKLPPFGGPMHGPNECASEALLKQALKIYIRALLKLDALDLSA